MRQRKKNLTTQKFDQINKGKSGKTRSKYVGVKIDPTAGSPTNSKIYYYRTSENLKIGQTFRAEMPTGGTPYISIVEKPSKKPYKEIKTIRRAK